MSMFATFHVAGSALTAQSMRLNAVASNLANVDSVVTANGKPYRAKQVVPLTLAHAAGQLYNMTPPTQGVISLAILGICERLGLAKLEPDSADHVHAVIEATPAQSITACTTIAPATMPTAASNSIVTSQPKLPALNASMK